MPLTLGPSSGEETQARGRKAEGSRNPHSRAPPASLIWDLLDQFPVLVAPTPHTQTVKGEDKRAEGKIDTLRKNTPKQPKNDSDSPLRQNSKRRGTYTDLV